MAASPETVAKRRTAGHSQRRSRNDAIHLVLKRPRSMLGSSCKVKRTCAQPNIVSTTKVTARIERISGF